MAAWRKSSHSAERECVEVATGVGIRDSKAPEDHLQLGSRAWDAFLSLVKR